MSTTLPSIICMKGKPCPLADHRFNRTLTLQPIYYREKLLRPAETLRVCSTCGAIEVDRGGKP